MRQPRSLQGLRATDNDDDDDIISLCWEITNTSELGVGVKSTYIPQQEPQKLCMFFHLQSVYWKRLSKLIVHNIWNLLSGFKKCPIILLALIAKKCPTIQSCTGSWLKEQCCTDLSQQEIYLWSVFQEQTNSLWT